MDRGAGDPPGARPRGVPKKLTDGLKEYAARQFELRAPSARGRSTHGAQLRHLSKLKNAPAWVKEINADEDEEPPGLLSQWGIFCDLARRRRSGFAGPEPITDSDLAAWEQGFGVRLAVWERTLIFELDWLYREAWSDRSSNARHQDSEPRG